MSSYQCQECDMKIKGIECARCDSELQHETIEIDGGPVNVCSCPDGCGKIKSPMCCGQDMHHQA